MAVPAPCWWYRRDERLVIPAAGAQIDDELVRTLRDAGQR
jgi:hypothetical protein